MKQILAFLKMKWRAILVCGWMVFVTVKLFDIESAACFSPWSFQDQEIGTTVDDIQVTIEDIKKDVSSINNAVSDIQSSLDDVQRKIRHQ